MGNEGKTKASNPRVRNFSAMMVRDHTKANAELKSIVSKMKMSTADKTDKDMKNMDMDKKMKNKTGAGFDKEFMNMMVEDHKKAVNLFENESKNGTDAELKAFAAKTLPTLQMHLDSATAINSSLNKMQSELMNK